MLQEGLAIPAGSSHIQEEMREVEDELEEEEGMMDLDGRKAALDMEEGHADGNSIVLNDFAKPSSSKKVHIRAHPLSAPGHSKSASGKVKAKLSVKDLKNSTRNFCGLFFSPVFAQAFILTFLGEWGDRSQIATIALAGVNVSVPPRSGIPRLIASHRRTGHLRSRIRHDRRPLYLHGYRRAGRSTARHKNQRTHDHTHWRGCLLGFRGRVRV